MTRFRERNLPLVGLVTIVLIAVLIAGALEFSKLPFASTGNSFAADFADSGGLVVGDVVTVDGVKVGTITKMALRIKDRSVRVSFTVASGTPLGADTTAEAKVLSPIGTEYLELVSGGPGALSGVIPMARTNIPYNLVTDLSKLGQQIEGYDIPVLEKSFETTANALSQTSAASARDAFNGLASFSKILGQDNAALGTILSQAATLTGVLSARSAQLVDLVSQSDLVLKVLAERKAAIQQLLASTSALTAEISGVLSRNFPQLQSLLSSLQTVSGVLRANVNNISNALPLLAAFSRYSANTTGSGAFADAEFPTTLIPDNVVAQCASASAYPSSNPQVGCRP